MINEVLYFDLEFEQQDTDFNLEYEQQDNNFDLEYNEIHLVQEKIPHNKLDGRELPNQHPIDSITNLREELDRKSEIEGEPTSGNLLSFSSNGKIMDSNYSCSDFVKTEEFETTINRIKDKEYIHVQSSASSIWNIVHNMNKMPSVTVVDSAGSRVFGDVVYINNKELNIIFTGAFSGKAYLN